MRSVLAASPLSLGAIVLRIESGWCAMENPSYAARNTSNSGWGSNARWKMPGCFKALAVHSPVDKLGNVIS